MHACVRAFACQRSCLPASGHACLHASGLQGPLSGPWGQNCTGHDRSEQVGPQFQGRFQMWAMRANLAKGMPDLAAEDQDCEGVLDVGGLRLAP